MQKEKSALITGIIGQDGAYVATRDRKEESVKTHVIVDCPQPRYALLKVGCLGTI